MNTHALTVNGMTIDELLAFHRAHFGNARMEAGGDGGGSGDGSSGGDAGKSFTQADVDAAVEKIAAKIRAEERRKVSEKYADYDDLKAKADGAKSLEDRIADLELNGSKSEQRALRAEIAGEFGISTKRGAKGEPSDAELFLTGTDEKTMRSQAERLAVRESERKKNGNRVPAEGNTTSTSTDDPMRNFARGLFGKDD